MADTDRDPDYSKMQGIYEVMNAGNYKQSLKLIGQYQTKFPSSLTLQALKALCLVQTKQHDDAIPVVKSLLASAPRATVVLHPLILAMKHLEMDLDLVKMLQEVVNDKHKLANDPETVRKDLFIAHLNAKQYSDMQHLATSMFKATKDAKYQLWSVMAMFLQAPADDPKSLMLTLATRFLEKMNSEGQLKDREVLWLYVSCLKRQGRYDDVLQLLGKEATAGILCVEEARMDWFAETFRDVGNRAAENGVSKYVLSKDEDGRENWKWWERYFDSLEAILGCSNEPTTVRIDDTEVKLAYDSSWEAAKEYIDNLAVEDEKTVTSTWPRRSMRLAQLHIKWLMLTRRTEKSPELLSELANGVVEYITWLKYKPQGFLDIMKFLPVLQENGLRDRVLQGVGKPDGSPVAGKESLSHELCSLKMLWASGWYDELSDEELAKQAHDLVKLNSDSMPLNKGLEYFERQVADDALLVSCNFLFQRYMKTGDTSWLLQTLLILELAPVPANNPHLQLWRLLAFSHIGVSRMDVFQEMQIKYIQFESLLYLCMGPMMRAWKDMDPILRMAWKFHSHFQRESAEMMFTAWNHSSCSKVVEMVEFRKRLAGSIQHLEMELAMVHSEVAGADAKAARQYLSSFSGTSKLRKVEQTLADPASLTANQDISCVDITFQCYPKNDRSESMRNALLQFTNGLATLDDRRDVCGAELASILCFEAVLKLGAKPEQPAAKKPVKQKKKGKDAKVSAAEAAAQPAEEAAVDPWKVVQERAVKACEAIKKVQRTASSHLAPASAREACWGLQEAVCAFVATSCEQRGKGGLGAALEGEVRRLGTALSRVADELRSALPPKGESKLTAPTTLVYLLRSLLPIALTTVREYLQAYADKELNKACSGVVGGAQQLVEAFQAVEGAMKDFRHHLQIVKKSESPDEAAKFLDQIAGKETQWVGSSDVHSALAKRIATEWLATANKIEAVASEKRLDVDSLIRLMQ